MSRIAGLGMLRTRPKGNARLVTGREDVISSQPFLKV
jgi:hypothetical protein